MTARNGWATVARAATGLAAFALWMRLSGVLAWIFLAVSLYAFLTLFGIGRTGRRGPAPGSSSRPGAVAVILDSIGPRPIEAAKILREHVEDVDHHAVMRQSLDLPARVGFAPDHGSAEELLARLAEIGAAARLG